MLRTIFSDCVVQLHYTVLQPYLIVCVFVSMVCLDWSGKRETRVSGQRPYFRVQSKSGRDPLVLEECRGGGLMVSWRWRN